MSTTEDRSGELQVYELGYLVLPSIPEESLPEVVNSLKEIVNKVGGTSLDGEDPFKRQLAYPMSKVAGSSKYVANDAYFGWMKFEINPDSVEEVKEGVESRDEILRFLLIKAPRKTFFSFAKAREAAKEEEAPEGDRASEEEVPETTGSEDVVE